MTFMQLRRRVRRVVEGLDTSCLWQKLCILDALAGPLSKKLIVKSEGWQTYLVPTDGEHRNGSSSGRLSPVAWSQLG